MECGNCTDCRLQTVFENNTSRVEDSTIIEALITENLALKTALKINYDFQSGIEEEVDRQLREEEHDLNCSVIFLGSSSDS